MNQRTKLEWSNNEAPAISASNLDGIVSDLNACATVLNKYDSMKQITAETVANYPDSHYKINKANVSAVSSAINAKGVHCSKLFKNIPSEILAIPEEGYTPQKGYIECTMKPLNKPVAYIIDDYCDDAEVTWIKVRVQLACVNNLVLDRYTEYENIPGSTEQRPIAFHETTGGTNTMFGVETQVADSYIETYEYDDTWSHNTPEISSGIHDYDSGKGVWLHGFNYALEDLERKILNTYTNNKEGTTITNYTTAVEDGTEISNSVWLSAVVNRNVGSYGGVPIEFEIKEGYVAQLILVSSGQEVPYSDLMYSGGKFNIDDSYYYSVQHDFIHNITVEGYTGVYIKYAKLN